MKMRTSALLMTLVLAPGVAALADPPEVNHQPFPCTVGNKAISLCAQVTDDGEIKTSRIYFRVLEEKFWYYTEMSFQGLNFCGTIPAPRQGKIKTIEYHIQATDNDYDSKRTSTYQLPVQEEGQCQDPPLEKDKERLKQIVVYATNAKQGKDMSDDFETTGVKFVPSPSR